MQTWRVRLFGELEARRGEERITRFGSRKNGALLALLAFKPGRAVLREAAMEILWPGVEPAVGRNRLSVALNALRKLLEPPGTGRGTVLVAEGDSLRLAAEAVASDVAQLEAALARARGAEARQRGSALDDALALATGPLLPGAEEEWVEREAERIAQLVADAALERARLHTVLGEGEAALELLLRAAAAAPMSLELTEAVLQTCLHLGRPGPGIAHFYAFEERYLDLTGHPSPRALRRLLTQLEALPDAPRPEVAPPVLRPARRGASIRAWVDAPVSVELLAEELRLDVLDPTRPAAFALGRVAEAVALHALALDRDRSARVVVDVVEAESADVMGARLLTVTPPGALFLAAPAAALYARAPVEGHAAHALGDLAIARVVEPVWALVPTGAPIPQPGARPHRRDALPATATRFVGREAELAQIIAGWRSGERLRTLVGPGGIGKTRLALQAARAILALPDGPTEAVMVSLAELRSESAVEGAIRDALGGGGERLLSAATRHVGERPVLLLLDNAEHLVTTLAPLTAGLLAAAPGLRVLCTSQRPLRIQGEVRQLVSPLPLPEPDQDLAALADHAAVRLFLDRARVARPDFGLTPLNAPAIVAVIRRLEGSPLAIEIAAARMGACTPAQVLTQLDEGVARLSSRQRDRATRHRSLEAAIRWNVDLLDPTVRRLWTRLSVFRVPFDLEAAEAVGDDPDAGDHLVELADAGLLVAQVADGTPVWRWLETLREVASAELHNREELERALAEWLVRRATESYEPFGGPDSHPGIAWFARNWGHILGVLAEGTPAHRVALILNARHFIERGGLQAEVAPFLAEVIDQLDGLDTPTAMELCSSALVHALNGGGAETAARATARVFALVGEGPDDGRKGTALASLGSSRHYLGEFELARRLFRRALEIFVACGSAFNQGIALENLANTAGDQGEMDEARSWSDAALALHLETGLRERLLPCRMYRALRALHCDDPLAAQAELDAADAVFSPAETPPWWSASAMARAQIALHLGDPATARTLAEACLARFEVAGQTRFVAFALQLLALIDLGDARYTDALARADRAADLFRAQSVPIEARLCLPTASLAAAGLGAPRLARQRLLAALDTALRMDATLGLPWALFAHATLVARGDPHAAARSLTWADRLGREKGTPIPRWMGGALSRLWNELPAPPAVDGSWRAYVGELLT